MKQISEPIQPHLQRMVDHGVSGLDIIHGELKNLILLAERELEHAQAVEDATEEAMDSMERTRAEGALDAYVHLYSLTYDISFAIADMEAKNA
jgi:hypothetical protein